MSTADSTCLARDLLLDGYGRITEGVAAVMEGLSADDLSWRPDGAANSIGWLVWHLSRQQDVQLAALAGSEEQVWHSQGWGDRLDLPYDADEMGYGQDAEEAARFRVADPALLVGYAEAVGELAARVVRGLDADDYARVVDESWDPPVTLAVRVYSVLEDAAKHLGQAEYLVGMLPR